MDRPNGMRLDIAQMIADLKPGLPKAFPGSCVMEAATVETGIQLEEHDRPPWSSGRKYGNAWDYRRIAWHSGMFEYLAVH